jgi:hypothetical protein
MNIFRRHQLEKEFKRQCEITDACFSRFSTFYRNNIKVKYKDLSSWDQAMCESYVEQIKSERFAKIGEKVKCHNKFYSMGICSDRYVRENLELIKYDKNVFDEFTDIHNEFCTEFKTLIRLARELSLNLWGTKWQTMETDYNVIMYELNNTPVIRK